MAAEKRNDLKGTGTGLLNRHGGRTILQNAKKNRRVRIANACTNPDLFWALQGGGGGTFGVVTRLTLRTHELPKTFGFVIATIRAGSEAAFRRLVGRFVDFYADHLHNAHWGEIVNVKPDNVLEIQLSFSGLEQQEAEALWQGGSYVAESDYFLRDWQKAYWGSHYPRLLEIKKKYDPSGLFFVHHGVGSEGWSAKHVSGSK